MRAKSYKKKLERWAKRRRRIVRMREEDGCSFGMIAARYNISRQRAEQLYKYGAEELAAEAREDMRAKV